MAEALLGQAVAEMVASAAAAAEAEGLLVLLALAELGEKIQDPQARVPVAVMLAQTLAAVAGLA